ncbi:hypothetical protein [Hyalangium rubrum]|uniref:DUF304 domain-containing protein n=1 Tax=Hyalangium rubrum TaxID=3103134 RepID=A0ABU5GXB7_9BACT|nr:hypothetical protein [Hyalangium sp. s54d21]MDY7225344.1 hypothetical protein [Hyalangium sp. s54d21]
MLEQAWQRQAALVKSLASRRWRHHLRQRPELLRQVRELEVPLVEALTHVEQRLGKGASQHVALGRLIHQLGAQREKLETLVLERRGGVGERGESLAQAIERLEQGLRERPAVTHSKPFQVEEDSQATRIDWRELHMAPLSQFVLNALFTGAVAGGLFTFRKEVLGNGMCLAIPALLLIAFLTFNLLKDLVNRTRVIVTRDELTIHKTALPWPTTRSLSRSQLARLDVYAHKTISYENGTGSRVTTTDYQLHAVDWKGRRQDLLESYDKEQMDCLKRLLDQALRRQRHRRAPLDWRLRG